MHPASAVMRAAEGGVVRREHVWAPPRGVVRRVRGSAAAVLSPCCQNSAAGMRCSFCRSRLMLVTTCGAHPTDVPSTSGARGL
jgi:hypothetical protein